MRDCSRKASSLVLPTRLDYIDQQETRDRGENNHIRRLHFYTPYLYAIPSGGDLADHVGGIYKNLTHAYPQGYLSTMPFGCYHGEGEWSTLDVAALVNPLQNWQSSKKCKVPIGEGYEAEGGPNGTAMAASPLISLPADIRTLDPAWAACDSKWQYALPWDPPRALVPVSALAGATTRATASFTVPIAVPKPSTPDPTAAPTTTSSRSISAINLVAPSSDGQSPKENPDTLLRHPHPHPHSSRPTEATRTVRVSTASGHITAASQPVLTVLPHQESTLQEKVTADHPNVALQPSLLRVPTKPAESETMVRYSSGKESQPSSFGIANPSTLNYAEAAAQAPDQDFPLILPALINTDTPPKGAPEELATTSHQGRLSIFPTGQSKNPERPISFSTIASFRPITNDANFFQLGAADNSISTQFTSADSTIPASAIPSAAADLGLLISMALGGNTLTSTFLPIMSNPTLLTDAVSVVPTSLTVPAAHSLEPSALMAISETPLTPTLRPTLASTTTNSPSFSSLIDSSAEAEAEASGSRSFGEGTTSPGGLNASTTPLHLVDDSKPTRSLVFLSASSVSISGSLTSTAPTLSAFHPLSNAARALTWHRHRVGLAIAVLVAMCCYLVN